MTLNDHFTLNSAFFAGMSTALKPDFRSLATIKLVVNVGEHQTETIRHRVVPCDSTAFFVKTVFTCNLVLSSLEHCATLLLRHLSIFLQI